MYASVCTSIRRQNDREKRGKRKRDGWRERSREVDNEEEIEMRQSERREVHALPLFAACVSPMSLPALPFFLPSYASRHSFRLFAALRVSIFSFFYPRALLSPPPRSAAAAGPFFGSVQFLPTAAGTSECIYGAHESGSLRYLRDRERKRERREGSADRSVRTGGGRRGAKARRGVGGRKVTGRRT